jgi:hypothetical protein
MSALPNGKGKCLEQRPNGICWNCGDKGHYKNKCPKPTKISNKSSSQNSSGTANVAVESDPETEYAFMADELWESDSELPPLLSNIDSDSDVEPTRDSEGDRFSEVSDNSDSECEMEQCHDLFYLASHSPECHAPRPNLPHHIPSLIASPNGSTTG